jgi:hypothetical protein
MMKSLPGLLRSRKMIPLLVGMIGIAIGLYVTIPLLADNGWNPSTLIKFPESKPSQLAYGNQMLGDVVPAAGDGHDGKYYFMQAMDPFYLEPASHAYLLDRPSYRAQRMVYPTLAGGFGLLPPSATAWTMWAVNIIAMGIGGWLTAKLALELGLSGWFGLAFVLNPGVVVSTLIDTAEVMALLFMLAGVLYVLKERTGLAITFLTLSALTRETMILATVGVVAYLWVEKRKVSWLYAVPFVALGAWWAYLRLRLADLGGSLQDTQAIGAPFSGFIEAVEGWLDRPGMQVHIGMGVLLLVISLFIAVRAVRQRDILLSMTAGFALLAVVMAEPVWRFYFDSSRALVPIITVYVLATAASISRKGMRSATSYEPKAALHVQSTSDRA